MKGIGPAHALMPRTPLRWLLGLSVLLSAWAVLAPQPPVEPAVAAAGPGREAARARFDPPEARGTRPAPQRAFRPTFEPIDFDPFAPPPAPAPRAAATVVVAEPPAPLPPPPVARPTLDARFAGRVVDPDGRVVIYLSARDQTLAAAPGGTLPGGFVVESVEPTEVRLRLSGGDGQALQTIAIPPLGVELR